MTLASEPSAWDRAVPPLWPEVDVAYDLETEWMRSARCRSADPEVFFPTDGVGVEFARAICAKCPVRRACLEFALDHRIGHGVWGGTSERERVRILRARRSML
jgi:WhiB family redox-sensing transcriptional regulator